MYTGNDEMSKSYYQKKKEEENCAKAELMELLLYSNCTKFVKQIEIAVSHGLGGGKQFEASYLHSFIDSSGKRECGGIVSRRAYLNVKSTLFVLVL
jgi:hypothetical protein